MALPLRLAIAFLEWQYRRRRPFPHWSLLHPQTFVVAAAIRFGGFGGLPDAGRLLSPVALALALARRHTACTVLFRLGAYLTWILDVDSYGAYS